MGLLLESSLRLDSQFSCHDCGVVVRRNVDVEVFLMLKVFKVFGVLA